MPRGLTGGGDDQKSCIVFWKEAAASIACRGRMSTASPECDSARSAVNAAAVGWHRQHGGGTLGESCAPLRKSAICAKLLPGRRAWLSAWLRTVDTFNVIW
jgi:hypothetical protein